MMNEFITFFAEYVAEYGYLIIFLFSFLENSTFLGLFAPGEVTAVLAGFYAGQTILNYWAVVLLIFAGSVLGDNLGFLLGRYKGKKWLGVIGPKLGYRAERIDKAEEFWLDHGSKAIFIGRFIAFARTFIPFLAGASKLKHSKFFVYDFFGALFHSLLLVTLGYFFGENYETLSATLGTIGIILLVVFIIVVYRYLIRKGVAKIED